MPPALALIKRKESYRGECAGQSAGPGGLHVEIKKDKGSITRANNRKRTALPGGPGISLCVRPRSEASCSLLRLLSALG